MKDERPQPDESLTDFSKRMIGYRWSSEAHEFLMRVLREADQVAQGVADLRERQALGLK